MCFLVQNKKMCFLVQNKKINLNININKKIHIIFWLSVNYKKKKNFLNLSIDKYPFCIY